MPIRGIISPFSRGIAVVKLTQGRGQYRVADMTAGSGRASEFGSAPASGGSQVPPAVSSVSHVVDPLPDISRPEVPDPVSPASALDPSPTRTASTPPEETSGCRRLQSRGNAQLNGAQRNGANRGMRRSSSENLRGSSPTASSAATGGHLREVQNGCEQPLSKAAPTVQKAAPVVDERPAKIALQCPRAGPTENNQESQRSVSAGFRAPRAAKGDAISRVRSEPPSRQQQGRNQAVGRLPKLVQEIDTYLTNPNSEPKDVKEWLQDTAQLELFRDELQWLVAEATNANAFRPPHVPGDRPARPRAPLRGDKDLRWARQQLRIHEREHAHLENNLSGNEEELKLDLRSVEESIDQEQKRQAALVAKNRQRERELARFVKEAEVGEREQDGNARACQQISRFEAEINVWKVKNLSLEKQVQYETTQWKEAQANKDIIKSRAQRLTEELNSSDHRLRMEEQKEQEQRLNDEEESLKVRLSELTESRRQNARENERFLKAKARELSESKVQQAELEHKLRRLEGEEKDMKRKQGSLGTRLRGVGLGLGSLPSPSLNPGSPRSGRGLANPAPEVADTSRSSVLGRSGGTPASAVPLRDSACLGGARESPLSSQRLLRSGEDQGETVAERCEDQAEAGSEGAPALTYLGDHKEDTCDPHKPQIGEDEIPPTREAPTMPEAGPALSDPLEDTAKTLDPNEETIGEDENPLMDTFTVAATEDYIPEGITAGSVGAST